MRRTSFEGIDCSIAQTLEIVGEWWSLLIVRDAMLGMTRFEEFENDLQIYRNILSKRLTHLVDHGVLARRPYQSRPARDEYVLTDKGRDLWQVIAALRQWGDRWEAPDGPPATVTHRSCGQPSTVVPVCGSCGEVLTPGSLTVTSRPSARGPRPAAVTSS